jgi:hypothetical protein
MGNRTLYLTLLGSTVLGFGFILALYAVGFGLNPINRLGYAFLVSVPPFFGALLVVKLTRVFDSWLGAFGVYVALFVLAAIIQALGRNIPV